MTNPRAATADSHRTKAYKPLPIIGSAGTFAGVQLLASLHAGEIHLVGESLSGAVAATYARMSLEQLERAIPFEGMLLDEQGVWRGGWLLDTLKTHGLEKAFLVHLADLAAIIERARAADAE